MINNAIGGIESAFSFGPWTVPTPFGSKTIGFHATFPRIGTIPYLASGAVIPPRSEFLAVLGDQKKVITWKHRKACYVRLSGKSQEKDRETEIPTMLQLMHLAENC